MILHSITMASRAEVADLSILASAEETLPQVLDQIEINSSGVLSINAIHLHHHQPQHEPIFSVNSPVGGTMK